MGVMDFKETSKMIEVNRNGNRIIANWKNDQIHGEAEIYYHNGVTFKYMLSYIEEPMRAVLK